MRRIQYTFNNTDSEGYQPPPCFRDWPEKTFEGSKYWTIDHCPELVTTHLNYVTQQCDVGHVTI